MLKQYRPEVIRFFILNSHYRSPLNYSQDTLNEALASLTRLYTALRDLPVSSVSTAFDSDDYGLRFKEAMDDDFNTAEAVAVLFELARDINRQKSRDTHLAAALAARLRGLASHLGLLETDPELFLKSPAPTSANGLSDDEIAALILARQEAKAQKNWPEADRIRQELAEQGIVLEDTAGQTTWRRE